MRIILDNWYQEYEQKYPQMIQSFKNYLRNREENAVINEVKKEILLMLYNNRGLVLKNSKKMKRIRRIWKSPPHHLMRTLKM